MEQPNLEQIIQQLIDEEMGLNKGFRDGMENNFNMNQMGVDAIKAKFKEEISNLEDGDEYSITFNLKGVSDNAKAKEVLFDIYSGFLTLGDDLANDGSIARVLVEVEAKTDEEDDQIGEEMIAEPKQGNIALYEDKIEQLITETENKIDEVEEDLDSEECEVQFALPERLQHMSKPYNAELGNLLETVQKARNDIQQGANPYKVLKNVLLTEDVLTYDAEVGAGETVALFALPHLGVLFNEQDIDDGTACMGFVLVTSSEDFEIIRIDPEDFHIIAQMPIIEKLK